MTLLRKRPAGVNVSGVAGAVTGAATLSLAYLVLRRSGLTRVDLAHTLAPGRPVAGRIAQVAAGTVACLPAARSTTPRRGLLAGLGAGAFAAATQRRPRDRALALATHGAAGAVAATVSRAVRARRRGA
jgi:uncharacterized membrane protein (UPF0136 family)